MHCSGDDSVSEPQRGTYSRQPPPRMPLSPLAWRLVDLVVFFFRYLGLCCVDRCGSERWLQVGLVLALLATPVFAYWWYQCHPRDQVHVFSGDREPAFAGLLGGQAQFVDQFDEAVCAGSVGPTR